MHLVLASLDEPFVNHSLTGGFMVSQTASFVPSLWPDSHSIWSSTIQPLSHSSINPFSNSSILKSNNVSAIASEWQDWGQWSQCTASCGQGFKFRARTCSEPEFGGNDQCPGNATEVEGCSSAECPGEHIQWLHDLRGKLPSFLKLLNTSRIFYQNQNKSYLQFIQENQLTTE